MLWLLLSLAFAQDAPPASGQPEPTPAAEVAPTSGSFMVSKATMTDEGLRRVRPWAELVLANPGWVFEVSAHTDSQGSDVYNQRLSQARAESVVDVMVEAGVPRGSLVARGYGEDRPVASNADAEGRTQNRRLELRKLRATGASDATTVGPTEPVLAASPGSWRGFSPELTGELGSGDERREGKLQVDTQRFEVPFDATFEAYHYHAYTNQPTARLIGPDGRAMPLSKGRSEVPLTEGAWTLEVTDSKKAVGPWGLRLKGISSDAKPAAGADTCTVLEYLVAQAHVGMRGARGAEIDGNFHQGPDIPGLPGRAVVHSTNEYWVHLYEGPDPAAASRARNTAKDSVTRCLSSGWSTDDGAWMTMSFKLKPSVSWQERAFSMRQQQGDVTILLKIDEEHRKDKAKSRLYLYRTNE